MPTSPTRTNKGLDDVTTKIGNLAGAPKITNTFLDMLKPLTSFDGTPSALWSSSGNDADVYCPTQPPRVIELPELEPIEDFVKSEPVDSEGNIHNRTERGAAQRFLFS